MNAATGPGRHALLVVSGRSELAFRDLHGEPLYAHALRALAEVAGPVVAAVDPPDLRRVRDDAERRRLPVKVLAHDHWWETVRATPGQGLLAHDVLCPLVTPEFLAEVSHRADERPATSFVAVRPVTDTLKTVVDGRILGTVDRERLVAVTSPIVLPPALLAQAGHEPPPVHDFAAMVRWLRARGDVELVRAPSLGRRVEQSGAIRLLECLDEVGHRARASVPDDRP